MKVSVTRKSKFLLSISHFSSMGTCRWCISRKQLLPNVKVMDEYFKIALITRNPSAPPSKALKSSYLSINKWFSISVINKKKAFLQKTLQRKNYISLTI